MKTKSILTVLLALAPCAAGFAEEPASPKRAEITINVLGAVSKPSRVKLPADANILDALAASGGASDGADLKRVKVVHKSDDGKAETDTINVKKIMDGATSNVSLHDGDTISVPKALIGIQY